MTRRPSFAVPLVAALALVGELGAQDLTIGLKGGLNVANVSADQIELVDTDSRTAFVGGGFLTIGLGERFAIQPEVLYAQKGFSVGALGTRASVDLDYFDIPVLLKVNLVQPTQQVRPVVFAGPFIAFETSCSVSGEVGGIGGSTDCDVALGARETTDAGIAFGAGVDIAATQGLLILLDARYNLGLVNLDSEAGSDSVKSRVWSFMAGFGIPLGG